VGCVRQLRSVHVRAMLHQNFDDLRETFITGLHYGSPVVGRLWSLSEQSPCTIEIAHSGHAYQAFHCVWSSRHTVLLRIHDGGTNHVLVRHTLPFPVTKIRTAN